MKTQHCIATRISFGIIFLFLSACGLTQGEMPSISGKTLKTGVVGTYYDDSIPVDYQNRDYTFDTNAYDIAVTAGAIPGGLYYSQGRIYGHPTVAGTFNFKMGVIVNEDCEGDSSGDIFTDIISIPLCADHEAGEVDFSITVLPAGTSLPDDIDASAEEACLPTPSHENPTLSLAEHEQGFAAGERATLWMSYAVEPCTIESTSINAITFTVTYDADKMRLAETFDDVYGYHSDVAYGYVTDTTLVDEGLFADETEILFDEALDYLGGSALPDNVTILLEGTDTGLATFTIQAPENGSFSKSGKLFALPFVATQTLNAETVIVTLTIDAVRTIADADVPEIITTSGQIFWEETAPGIWDAYNGDERTLIPATVQTLYEFDVDKNYDESDYDVTACYVVSGALPNGITLDTHSCALSGTSTAIGPYDFVIVIQYKDLWSDNTDAVIQNYKTYHLYVVGSESACLGERKTNLKNRSPRVQSRESSGPISNDIVYGCTAYWVC